MRNLVGIISCNTKSISHRPCLLGSEVLCTCHTHLIDEEFNNSISGTIESTTSYQLPVFSHLLPTYLRRQHTLIKEFRKISKNPQMNVMRNGLGSRNPPMKTARLLHEKNIKTRLHIIMLCSDQTQQKTKLDISRKIQLTSTEYKRIVADVRTPCTSGTRFPHRNATVRPPALLSRIFQRTVLEHTLATLENS